MKKPWVLREGEEYVHSVWPSAWRQLPAILIGVFCIGIFSLFWFPLIAVGFIGKCFLFFGMFFSWWLLIRAACYTRRTQLICTTQRIIFVQARGCFDRQSDQAVWSDVLDIAYKPDGLWRLWRLSQLRIRFHGARSPWVIRGVQKGGSVCRLIRDIQALPHAPKPTGSFDRQHLV